jgi:hypothetical protein
MALVRMVSTARLVHLTASLCLVLTIMSCTSPSCQAGGCTYPHLLLFFLLNRVIFFGTKMTTLLVIYNYLNLLFDFVLGWVALHVQVMAAFARRRRQHG